MADFSMWGPSQLGARTFDIDQQAKQLNALTQEKMQGEIAAQPDHLELLKAQVRDFSAQALERSATAKLTDFKVQEAQRVNDIMKEQANTQKQAQAVETQKNGGAAPGQPNPLDAGKSFAMQQLDLASKLAAGGAYTTAQGYAMKGMEMLGHVTSAEANQARQRNSLDQAAERETKLTAQYLGGAKNPQEFEAGKLGLMAALPSMSQEERSQLMSTQYSPQVVQHIADRAVTEEEKRKKAMTAAENVSKDKLRRTREGAMSFDRNWDNIQKREQIRRDTAEAKAGGKPMGNIPPKQLDRTNAAVSRAIFPEGVPPESKNAVADATLEVVGQVQSMMKANKGMTESEALQRAVASNAKDWQTIKGRQLLGVQLGKDTKTFSAAGKTPETAMPAGAATTFVEGRYYTNASGVTAQKTKGGWKPVAAKAAARAPVDIPDEAAVEEAD